MLSIEPYKTPIESLQPAVSRAQLTVIKEIIHALIKKRIVTYGQISQQLGVEQDVLKAFCLGKSIRPRGDFVKMLILNLKRIQVFTEEIPEENLKIKRILIDLSGQEYNYTWYQGYAEFIGADEIDTFKNNMIIGEYAIYRPLGSGSKIFKSKLYVEKPEYGGNSQFFNISHKLVGQNDRMSSGILNMVGKYAIFNAKISNKEGIFSIYAERGWNTEFMAGIMTVARNGDRIFSSRVVIVKITGSYKALEMEFGIISIDKMKEEIGYISNYVTNEIGTWDLLEVIRS